MGEEVHIQVQSILYRNRPQEVARAVEAVANAAKVCGETAEINFKISILHGDASPEPLFTDANYEEMAARYAPYLTMEYRFFDENTGHAQGQNRLAAGSKSDYILILNPDVVVGPQVFKQLLAPFRNAREGKVGISEARQIPIEHSKSYDCETGVCSWAMGACMMVPTALFLELGGFDFESFYMYCDDVDFSWRVRMAGFRIVYVPEAVVFHAKRLTPDGQWMPSTSEVYYSAEAALMMAHKWSAEGHLQTILKDFKQLRDGSVEKQAVAEFERRAANGTLAAPIDPAHRVADFTRDGYGAYRFSW